MFKYKNVALYMCSVTKNYFHFDHNVTSNVTSWPDILNSG